MPWVLLNDAQQQSRKNSLAMNENAMSGFCPRFALGVSGSLFLHFTLPSGSPSVVGREAAKKKKNEKGQAEIQESSQVVKTQPSLHQEKGESQDIYVRLWILSRGF